MNLSLSQGSSLTRIQARAVQRLRFLALTARFLCVPSGDVREAAGFSSFKKRKQHEREGTIQEQARVVRRASLLACLTQTASIFGVRVIVSRMGNSSC